MALIWFIYDGEEICYNKIWFVEEGLGPIYSDSWFFTLITCHMIIDMMMELLDEHKGTVM